MKRIFSKRLPKAAAILLLQILLIGAFTASSHAAKSILNNIREGLHPNHSRIVLDCRGVLPSAIGPASSDYILVGFDDLIMHVDIDQITRRLRGGITRIVHQKVNGTTVVKLLFKTPGVRVKSFVLQSDSKSDDRYRVVLDIYPADGNAQSEEKAVSKPLAKAGAATVPVAAAPLPSTERAEPPVQLNTGTPSSLVSRDAEPKPAVEENPSAASSAVPDASTTNASETSSEKEDEASLWAYAAEVGVVLRAADGEDDSAKFEAYRDISRGIAGDLSFEAQKDRRRYIRGKAENAGQDDQFVGVEAGDYAKYAVKLSYDNSIHRYVFGAKTPYSGVGSGTMTLDDALQANVQAAPTAVETANRLNGFLASAATGDPDVTRDTLKLGLNLFVFDPFSIKLELAHEKREGTRPFTGAFGTTEMVELFEPIDYDTLEMKISAEYASKPVFLNLAYQYCQFANHTDTLTFDNPLIATDAMLQPSKGRIDLAPDNQYHHVSLTSAFTQLPWDSQLNANAAWGLTRQDDHLVPFTSNSAITAPTLPVNSIDAEVLTSLYNLRITSKPLPYMRVKGHVRYYDYDNRTDQIDFSNGYVETDAFTVATAITNLPSSYTKTRAGLDLGFDVGKRTGLGVGYQYERTDRENREVEKQDDHKVKVSADNRSLDWMDIRASYERTNREIGAYNFDVYLESGDNLDELPQLRKYDQADLVRDRIKVQSTFYPTDTLSLSPSITYGMDDFKASPYGLLEDSHYMLSFDADYVINARAAVNFFYSLEEYKNSQCGNDSGTDWLAQGEDQVHTFGGSLKLALIPQRLDLDLTYSYSDVDGSIAFSSPSGSFAEFSDVDDTQIHALDTKLKYRFTKSLTLSMGYLWEKFDYDDFALDGFSFVPIDAGGNYQGALLSGALPEAYDVHIIYTQLTFRYR